jgi:hypothetical protein
VARGREPTTRCPNGISLWSDAETTSAATTIPSRRGVASPTLQTPCGALAAIGAAGPGVSSDSGWLRLLVSELACLCFPAIGPDGYMLGGANNSIWTLSGSRKSSIEPNK